MRLSGLADHTMMSSVGEAEDIEERMDRSRGGIAVAR